MDTNSQSPIIVANNTDTKTLIINPTIGLSNHIVTSYVTSLGMQEDLIEKTQDLILKLYKAFVENDCLSIELTPLAIISEKYESIMVIDSKMIIDSNAKFRQREIYKLEDRSNMSEIEAVAEGNGFNHIKLSGNIGCLVNEVGSSG